MSFHRLSNISDISETLDLLYSIGLITQHYYVHGDAIVKTDKYDELITYLTLISENEINNKHLSKKDFYSNKKGKLTKGY